MHAWKRILMFFVYIGFVSGIIIGLMCPIWILGWILFLGLIACFCSNLLL